MSKAALQDPDNVEIQRELALALYLKSDLNKALETIKPLLDRRDADIQVYQVAGMIYKGREDFTEADRLYKKGIKKFPESGMLYNDYGELLWHRNDVTAIKVWEKGMEMDPNYTGNYYSGAKYYGATNDKIWSIIYGEIFVNMESSSRRTIEIKNLILEGYKKLLTSTDASTNTNNKNPFCPSLSYCAWSPLIGHLYRYNPRVAYYVTNQFYS